MRQILGQGEVQEKLKELGVESRSLTPDEFDAYLKVEYRRWGAVIRKAGITLEK